MAISDKQFRLIMRHIDGELTDRERKEFKEQMKDSEEFNEELKSTEHIIAMIKAKERGKRFQEIKETFLAFDKINQKNKFLKIRNFSTLATAAVIVFLLVAFISILQTQPQDFDKANQLNSIAKKISLLSPTMSNHEIDSSHKKIYGLLDINIDSSYLLAEQTLKYAKENNYTYGQANSLYIVGYIYYVKNQHNKALLNYFNAIDLLKEKEDFESKKLQSTLLINCGDILEQNHNYPRAIDYYNKSEQIISCYNIKNRLIDVLYNKSLLFKTLEQYKNANLFAEKSLKISSELQNMTMIGHNWNLLGLIAQKEGKYETAIAYFNKLLYYDFQEEQDKWKAWAYHNIAEVHKLQGNYDSAKYYYEFDLQLSLQAKNPEEPFETYLKLSELHVQFNEFKKGEQTALRALNYYNEVPLTIEYIEIYQLLRKAAYRLGKYVEANHYSDRYAAENRKFLDQKNELLKQTDQYNLEHVFEEYELQKEIDYNRGRNIKWTWIFTLLIIIVLLCYSMYNQWNQYKQGTKASYH